MNKTIIKDSLLVTFVVSLIITICSMLGDAVVLPAQIVLGADSKQVHDSQNMTLLTSHPYGIFISMIVIFLLSLLMLSYLCHGETLDEYKKRTKNRRYEY